MHIQRGHGEGVGRRSRRGLTLLELTIAMSLLSMAYLGYSSAMMGTIRAAQADREATLALEAARQILAELRANPFEEVFAQYNSDPADDPDGPGRAPGANVAVFGLEPAPDDVDGFVGEIIFPAVAGAGGLELREDLARPDLGLPRDLNGDGVVDAANHSGDYRVLPVRVRIRWRGAAGSASLEFYTLIGSL